jgi:trehalose 6-phosphate phosphatase
MAGDRGLPLSIEVRRALAPLLVRPSTTAILTDFDGTLAPIVADPAAARPLDGVVKVLGQLAHRYGTVGVISGRPIGFLAEHLTSDLADDIDPAGALHLVGLYGFEWSTPSGGVERDPLAEAWRPVVEEVAERLTFQVPEGVMVESKGLTVTVHWRGSTTSQALVSRLVEAEVSRTHLDAHPGRMSVELRPPLPVDKGSVVRRLAAGCTAAAYLGDDLGDLPAFGALRSLAAEEQMSTLSIAVVDTEADGAVAAAADLTASGPAEALELLQWLAKADGPGPT